MSMKLQLLSAAPETLWLIRQSVLLTTSGALVLVYDRFRGALPKSPSLLSLVRQLANGPWDHI